VSLCLDLYSKKRHNITFSL